jgi:hypothetical protein
MGRMFRLFILELPILLIMMIPSLSWRLENIACWRRLVLPDIRPDGRTDAYRTASYIERCGMEVPCGDRQVKEGATDGRYVYMYDIEVQADR